MSRNILTHEQLQALHTVLERYPAVMPIAQQIHAQHGQAFLVGGAVRDLLLGLPIKDLDVEVYGLTLHELELILRAHGYISLVGKSFGVVRVHGLDVDWSLPRTDSAGRKPEVVVDPHMTFNDASARRDLTINAMGIDLVSGELMDPYDGLGDLQARRLRAPRSDLFVQDPLRFYRVMQFVGRFEMTPDEELNRICASMNLRDISHERIEGEFEKLILRSVRPSRGLRWIKSIGRLEELLPELAATIGIEQDPGYHPEGDVFEHSMQSFDAAASLAYDTDEQKMILALAALCHDLGKVTKTQKTADGITSYGHDVEGAVVCKPFLKRINRKINIGEAVPRLVRYHMQPIQLVSGGAKTSAYKRLARHLAPYATISMLAQLAYADARGRNAHGHEPLTCAVPGVDAFLAQAQHAYVEYKPEEPVLYGRDIMDIVSPGPAMGALLKAAYEIQIEEGIKDKEVLKKRIIASY